MRLFVALSLPEPVREQLGAFEDGLPGARWVPEDNLHLTLRFIGEVDGGVARDIDSCLAEIAMPAFEASFDRLDTFGDGRNLRALWVGVASPNEPLLRLQAKVEKAVVRAGLAPESRKFTPHVTLARFSRNNGRVPADKMQAYLSQNARLRIGPVQFDRFTLFSSVLHRDGSIYTPEADYPLERPLAVGQL